MKLSQFKKSMLAIIFGGIMLGSSAQVHAGWFDWLWGSKTSSGQTTSTRSKVGWIAAGVTAVAAAGAALYQWWWKPRKQREAEQTLERERERERKRQADEQEKAEKRRLEEEQALREQREQDARKWLAVQELERRKWEELLCARGEVQQLKNGDIARKLYEAAAVLKKISEQETTEDEERQKDLLYQELNRLMEAVQNVAIDQLPEAQEKLAFLRTIPAAIAQQTVRLERLHQDILKRLAGRAAEQSREQDSERKYSAAAAAASRKDATSSSETVAKKVPDRSQSATPSMGMTHGGMCGRVTPPPRSMSADFAKELGVDMKRAIDFYNKGRLVFQRLVNEGTVYTPSMDDIRDLLWFMYQYASLKDDSNRFEEGSFVIADDSSFERGAKESRIDTIFSKIRHLIPATRMSSHLPAYNVPHYGLDLSGLPAQKQTLLFIKPTDHQLFIKPESHGVGFSIEGICHLGSYVKSSVRKVKLLRGLIGMQSDDGQGYRKERVPEDVVSDARELLNELVKLGKMRKEGADFTFYTMSGFGISSFVYFFEKRTAESENIQKWVTAIKARYPDWQYRIGNEVILFVDELLATPPLVFDAQSSQGVPAAAAASSGLSALSESGELQAKESASRSSSSSSGSSSSSSSSV